MDPEIKKYEDKHLNEVTSKVKKAKEVYEGGLKVIGQGNLDRLRDIRESGETGMDFEMLIYQLGEKNRLNLKEKLNRLQELEYLSGQPYFARIDLKDTDTDKNHEIYIGKFGYTEFSPVVTDWRAKVASVYYRYRYPQKNVSYDTPEGKVTKDLTLKRSYEIENGKLFKYFNNDIQLDESGIIIDKISKRTGGVLEDIVETIQLSQLNIIEADPRQICIVQGCVGSGKSTVAIHKLAHIFFNYPKQIHPERSILIAKNQILTGYLSTLFPKLGIFDINYKTLRELVYNLIFREETGLQVDLDLDQNTKDFNIKKIGQLQSSIEKIHGDIENKLNDLFTKSEFISFRGMKYSRFSTPFENLSDILNDLEEELSTEREFVKENPNSEKSYLYKENLKALRKLTDRLTTLKSEVKSKVLKKIVEGYGIDTNKKLGYCEALVYTYLYSEIVGLQKFTKYEYCVVDEGQDFSLLEFLILSKLVIRGRFAIFGDLNQSLESDGIEKWDYIGKVITEAKKAETFELDTNYRSSKQIVDLAKKILSPYSKTFLPKSINRNGEEPIQQVLESNEEMLSEFKKFIDEDAKNITKSIGIICTSDEILELVRPYLVYTFKDKITELSSDRKIQYTPTGIYLMSVDNCKGLEFSKVYVLGLDLSQIKTIHTARKAFVAVTRAMNELVVIGTKRRV